MEKLINKIYQQLMQEVKLNADTNSLKHAIQAKIMSKQPSKSKFIPQKVEKTSKDDKTSMMPQNQIKLLSAIAAHEEKEQPGYFKFEGWLNFHKEMFPTLPDRTVSNFWKILRVINYGEVTIPTGLIYELFQFLIAKRERKSKKKEEIPLRERINKFLVINKMKDFVNNFRELSNFPSLEEIQKEYLQISPLNFASDKGEVILATEHQLGKKSSQLFDRLYRQSKIKYESKQRLIYQSIAAQMDECKFKPSINQYKSRQQLKRSEKFCSTKHEHSALQQKPIPQFVARQIDKKIYNDRLNLIYGVQQHIARTKLCEAQRLRLQRYYTKPWLRLR